MLGYGGQGFRFETWLMLHLVDESYTLRRSDGAYEMILRTEGSAHLFSF